MLLSRYKITLPSDYDMNIIRNRVKNNGYKTDTFPGLGFKLYLITVKGEHGNTFNSYSPLYLWNDTEGLNKFLFEGFYDNILQSFGWQRVELHVPLVTNIDKKLNNVKFIYEISGNIDQSSSLNNIKEKIENGLPKIPTPYVIAYDPALWQYKVFYFLDEAGDIDNTIGITYQVLHVSQ